MFSIRTNSDYNYYRLMNVCASERG